LGDLSSDSMSAHQAHPIRRSIAGSLIESADAAFACVPVSTGQMAPIAGFFTASDDSMVHHKVNRDAVAHTSGKFCVESATLALLQRSFSIDTSDLDLAVSRKSDSGGTTTEGTTTEGTITEKTGGGSDGFGLLGSLQGCADTGSVGNVFCQGTNRYACKQALVVESCGALGNACCADVDGDCGDGDYAVKCIQPNLRSCNDTGSVGDDKCPWCVALQMCDECYTESCGGVDNACCADEDGSCTDGDTNVRCIVLFNR